jgi:hypothetical protein
VPVSATSLHSPRQQVLPLSSKNNDNMDNIESDIYVGTKLNRRSSWSDSIIAEECLNKHRVHDAKIKHPKKKIVLQRILFFPQYKVQSQQNRRYNPNTRYLTMSKCQIGCFIVKGKMQFLLNISLKLICMTHNRLVLSIMKRLLLLSPLILLLHQCSQFLSLFVMIMQNHLLKL